MHCVGKGYKLLQGTETLLDQISTNVLETLIDSVFGCDTDFDAYCTLGCDICDLVEFSIVLRDFRLAVMSVIPHPAT